MITHFYNLWEAGAVWGAGAVGFSGPERWLSAPEGARECFSASASCRHRTELSDSHEVVSGGHPISMHPHPPEAAIESFGRSPMVFIQPNVSSIRAQPNIIVEPLAKHALAPHSVHRHQQRGFQQPLGAGSTPFPPRCTSARTPATTGPAPSPQGCLMRLQRMLFRHALLRSIARCRRPSPFVRLSSNPIAHSTHYTGMRFERLSTALYADEWVPRSR